MVVLNYRSKKKFIANQKKNIRSKIAVVIRHVYFGCMTLFEFKLLSNIEKAKAVWNHGEHIGTRHSSFYTISLWQIEGFYAELFYNRINSEITKIKSFQSTELLTPYLSQIDISAIFSGY